MELVKFLVDREHEIHESYEFNVEEVHHLELKLNLYLLFIK